MRLQSTGLNFEAKISLRQQQQKPILSQVPAIEPETTPE
jgi:hypothetical protein